ncbi:MAG: endonuclease domain-containing protein [Chitinophagaceae bacterium]
MKRKMHAGAGDNLYQRARELRNRSTHAEDLLWGFLKTKPFGFKFRRQHPYAIFILDFYCHKLKLVIEVDGSVHDTAETQISDQERQEILEKDGLEVNRFSNEEIIAEIEKVKRK